MFFWCHLCSDFCTMCLNVKSYCIEFCAERTYSLPKHCYSGSCKPAKRGLAYEIIDLMYKCNFLDFFCLHGQP